MVVFSLIIIDVYHVDLVELAPLYAFAIQICDAVGGQIGYLYANLVVPCLEGVFAVENVGDRPCASDELTINIYTSRLADIT